MKLQAITAIMFAAIAGTCFGDLPGLPPAAAPVVAPSAAAGDVRGIEPVQAIVVQTGPIRGSLFKQGAAAAVPLGADGQPLIGMRTAPVSFIAVQPAQPRRYRKNDLITVIIREDSKSTTDGKGSSNKKQEFDLAIEQFIKLALASTGLPTIQQASPSSLPEIKFKYDNTRESDASQERQDSVSARLTATIVDVKPNGTMVVEATKHIVIDKEEQIFKLSGTCRVEDVSADNTLLSTQLANLSLSKQTKGEVRDTTKRGWLNKFIDTVSPF